MVSNKIYLDFLEFRKSPPFEDFWIIGTGLPLDCPFKNRKVKNKLKTRGANKWL